MPDSNKETIVKPTVEARQGVTGHNVRYVLFFGVAGAAILLGIVFLVFVG
ncbi:MAG: hypothetical protein R3D62_02010 [Xanthobacteraceae bacterium]